MTIMEQEVSDLKIGEVLDLLSSVVGSEQTDKLLVRSTEAASAVQLSGALRESILANRDHLHQARIDLQQARIESQQTRLDLADFRRESGDLFAAFDARVALMMSKSQERAGLLIADIRAICEEQLELKLERSRKRKLSATEEELLSLTDPHYVPDGDNIYSEDERNGDQDGDDDGNVQHAMAAAPAQNGGDHAAAALAVVQAAGQAAGQDPATLPPNTARQINTTSLPFYKMVRGTDNIKYIWEEYTRGVNGGPAVRDLEMTYAGKWKDDTERKYFSYRRKLYNLITNVMRVDGKSEDEAIAYLETVIADHGSRKSMTWLYENVDDRYKSV